MQISIPRTLSALGNIVLTSRLESNERFCCVQLERRIYRIDNWNQSLQAVFYLRRVRTQFVNHSIISGLIALVVGLAPFHLSCSVKLISPCGVIQTHRDAQQVTICGHHRRLGNIKSPFKVFQFQSESLKSCINFAVTWTCRIFQSLRLATNGIRVGVGVVSALY